MTLLICADCSTNKKNQISKKKEGGVQLMKILDAENYLDQLFYLNGMFATVNIKYAPFRSAGKVLT